jgi:dihydroorotase/N-acyl-D-amino-acid deacylase
MRARTVGLTAFLLPLVLTVALVPAAQPQEPLFDLLIRNGRIVDGTGSPWFRANVAIRGEIIVRIGDVEGKALQTIDAAGQIVAPGFIDVHTHARRAIFELPSADNYIRQGVTTVIEGPDGSSPIPLKPFFDKVEAVGVSPNVGAFIGQGSVREQVLGTTNRAASPAELDKMRALVALGMDHGALGLSSGLFYVPGAFTPTTEVVELARVAGRAGGIYISHMREEASRVLDSVRETIEIGEMGGLPTQITHHKIIGRANWGRSVDTLALVEAARARGVDATIDQYPYTASSTSLSSALIPAWALEGGEEATVARLKDTSARARIRQETARIISDERGGGDPQNVQLARCDWDPSLAGKRLGDVTRARGSEPTIENAAETALWIVERGDCTGIFHAIDESDLQRILRHSATMIASDGEVAVFGRASPHPRSYGTFVRVLGRYVRDLGLLPLEEAVRKMTAFPAQRLGLPDRGILRERMKADIVVFDPLAVRDRATFEQPHQYAEGVAYVVVNGQVAFGEGRMMPARPGRIVRGNRKPW